MIKWIFLTTFFFAAMLLTAERAAVRGQGLIDRFAPLLRSQPEEPDGPAPAPSSSYIGLLADDRGEAGRGVRVLSVRAGGPAEKAGIRRDDLVMGIGSQKVSSIADMASIVAGSRPGEPLKFSVDRSGRRLMISVEPTLRPPPEADSPVAPEPEMLPPPRSIPAPAPRRDDPVDERPLLGVRVTPLDPASRRSLPLLVRRGVVIQSVDFGSPAERAGLPVGAVIVAVNGRRIDSPEDLVAAINAARPGQEVEVNYYHQRVNRRKQVTLAGPGAAEPDRSMEERPDLPLLVAPERDGSARVPDSAPPAADPPGGRFLPGGDLPPAVREVERVLEGILRPGEAPAARTGEREVAALKAEIEILKRQVQRLEKRLAELERREDGVRDEPE